jgi:transcription elongation factor Elf1
MILEKIGYRYYKEDKNYFKFLCTECNSFTIGPCSEVTLKDKYFVGKMSCKSCNKYIRYGQYKGITLAEALVLTYKKIGDTKYNLVKIIDNYCAKFKIVIETKSK